MIRLSLELEHAVQTGEPTGKRTLGADLFDYLADHSEENQVFNDAMTDFRRQFTPAVLSAYDWSSIGTLVDIGGGYGVFLTSVLTAHPGMRGVIFDLPHIVEATGKAIAEAGVDDRCQVVGGDFFASVPTGGDAYVLSWIIHDWDDERALAILRNCQRAMSKTSRLVLLESVVPRDGKPHFAHWLDLVMLLLGGQERTEAEYSKLLDAAGFRLTQIIPTAGPISVIEATPA